ncbi:hypothetical protein H4O18_00870 [Arenibacter sp. BSSL-BM3]|uniref:Uncharacterized protein n=1 Tax=Arenibacter arenosicollis TaxID=2762274 RepID=A0ABR7QH59_9FLAO|nr:hypothetical protein [Arenibacter arenosicollis]MBC8766531.1 hypothetical protein [Arenibacter arenosicollis]
MGPLSFKDFKEDVTEITHGAINKYGLTINLIDEYQIYASNKMGGFWFYHEDIYILNMVYVDVKTDIKTPFLELFKNKNIECLYPFEAGEECVKSMILKRQNTDKTQRYHKDICRIKKMSDLLIEYFTDEF